MEEKEVKRPARKRVKKEKVSPLIKEINIMAETGKYEIGSRKGMVSMLLGESKLVILAEGSRKDIKEDIEKFCEEGKIPLLRFKGNSLALGSVLGRAHPVSVVVVYDVGKSKLLELASAKG